MKDQERLIDFLSSEKKMSANYDTYASECVNTMLRDDFLRLLKQSHMTQSELFRLAQTKGWYQVEQANPNQVSQVYTKYFNQLPMS